MNFFNYLQHDLAILPLKGKRPFVENWYEVDFSISPNKYSWESIGLKTGEMSGIIALDFDSKDEEIKKKILKLIPPILCGKKGNRDKLPTMFFRFNNESSQDLRNIEVQLLSTGKQTVLPPSKHPDFNYNFEWVNKSLLEIDIDDLPFLEPEVWNSLVALNDGADTSSKDQQTSGRNNDLKAQVTAAIMNGKSIDEIIKEVISYDQINHSPPLFEDKSEPYMKGSTYSNALGFVSRIVSSLSKNTKIEIPEPATEIIIDLSEKPIVESKFKKLPKLEGLGNDLFHEFYDQAPIPRTQFAFQQALFVTSLLIGNKFMFRGTGANLYLYGIGPSGSGKDYPLKRAQQLLNEANLAHLIGTSSPTSETVMLKSFQNSRVMGCWWNEAEKVLKTMSNAKTNFGLIECVTDLYDGVGKTYFPKSIIGFKGNLDKFGYIYSPFLNVCMMSTVTAFSENAKAEMFDTGFLSRFELFFEDRFRAITYRENYNPSINPNFTSFIARIGASEAICDDLKAFVRIPNLMQSTGCLKAYREVFDIIQREIMEMKDSKFFGVITRKLLRVNKYIMLHHFMMHPENPLDHQVSARSISWAYDAVSTIFHNMLLLLPNEVHQNEQERMDNAMINEIKKFNKNNKPATKCSIANGLRWMKSSLRNEILKDLLERQVIGMNEKREFFVK